MSKRLYSDISAKIVVEAQDNFNTETLAGEITVLNKGNAKDFEVTNCLVEHAIETNPIDFFNLKNALSDSGEVTENKYSGLTKEDATQIKKDLKNLFKLINGTNQGSVHVNQTLEKVIKILENTD
tara:strand:+ start:41 stop:415 length:375 start_codon:yes stop_codon:yes gene_type:complete